MTYPDTEVLNSLVGRVFIIEDVTHVESKKGLKLRYRGHLQSYDSASAYDQLAAYVEPYGLTPLFRIESDQQVIYLITTPPARKPSNPWINLILFVITVFSVMLVGVEVEGLLPPGSYFSYAITHIFTGWPFALAIMGILLAHEFGHYLVSRYHKTPATLPYFIPLPISPLGTMGAAILMKGIPKNRRILFDIGVAGPLAGMLVAIPILLYGLNLSKIDTVSDLVYPPALSEQELYCPNPSYLENSHGEYVCPQDNIFEGNSLLYLGAKYFSFGQLLPAPSDYGDTNPAVYWLRYFFTGQPLPIGGQDVTIHKIAFAGWAGILVTALNLIPAGTLDGGHVVYAFFGDKARRAFPYLIGLLLLLGFFWSGWWLWAVLLFWLGRVNAETLDQITPLDSSRRVVALGMLILFVLVFTPVPIVAF